MLKKDKNYKNTPSKNFDNIILSSFPQEISVRPLPDIAGVEARVFYQSLSLRFNYLIVDVDGWMLQTFIQRIYEDTFSVCAFKQY